MKIAIVQFPGSNCERETALAVKRAGMKPVEFMWNAAGNALAQMDGYILVGGFSYEDRSRAGIIAALDPVMQIIRQQSDLGKPVLGICNGAQILVETGLIPGLKNNQLAMALTENKRIAEGKVVGTGFYNAWIHLRIGQQTVNTVFTRHLSTQSIIKVPIAHGEGRFVMPLELLDEIEQDGLNVFRYCDEQGEVIDNFPINPNGSMANIAAISNRAGNVMAMMPHPERTVAGDPIFRSMHDYLLERNPVTPSVLAYCPPVMSKPPRFQRQDKQELLVKLIITDNHALTVQNTLRQLGIPVKVQRMVHWQIDGDNPELMSKIAQTGLLYNERKEYLDELDLQASNSVAFLVRPLENIFARQQAQILREHFDIEGLKALHHGLLWIFSSEEMPISDLSAAILQTQIIFNPYAHECYDYE